MGKKKKVASPCIGVCRIDRVSGFCIGCARTPTEIRRWKRAENAEKRLILSSLPARLPAVSAGQLRRHDGGCHCGTTAVPFATRRQRQDLTPSAHPSIQRRRQVGAKEGR